MNDLFDDGGGMASLAPFATVFPLDPFIGHPALNDREFSGLLTPLAARAQENEATTGDPAAQFVPTEFSGKDSPAYQTLMMNGDDDATDLGEVIVTGRRPMSMDEINQILADLDEGVGVGGDGIFTGGGGASETDTDEECGCPSTGASQEQQEARSSAADGADIILQQNWENQEYGGFIYRDAVTGEIKMGVITGSAVTTWSPTADNMQGISSYSQIIGIVHSHGPNVPGSNHNLPSSGDWGAFDDLIAMGASNLTAYYILGADGQLREYDGSDRTNTSSGEVVSDC